jgi:deferrochelatase/peroxidase EfeB
MPMEAQSPGAPPPADEKKVQAPLRFASDVRGRRCPFGAHIRRANPRDSLDDSPEVSLRLVANHRIIRRGRMYGPAAPAFWYPAGVEVPRLDSGDKPASDERGIVFVALCSDLTRQFEFIQQTWMNNPKFLDLNDESDPIAAGTNIVSNDGHFTVPGDPVRRRIPGLPLFTTIRAGGYFLMPGREALDLIFRPN